MFVPAYLVAEMGTELLRDPEITEIMVNGPNEVYIERKGRLELRPDIRFRDEHHLLNVINTILAPLGRRIDEDSPMVDARLPDGSRVNAVLPPVALKGPVLTIRRFRENPLTIDELLSFGTFSEEMLTFLAGCVQAKLNILVSGGTGSGKTTTLNVLSSFIPKHERIVTVEDTAELRLRQPHVVQLEARPPNEDGEGEITIRDLVRNSLRMRPDRIIVGEVRGAEALDMLQAMNTGHEGSMTTIHANSPEDAFSRLETMVMWAGVQLPSHVIREQLVAALDIVIQQNRLIDGSRKIVAISEIQGVEDGHITLEDIFVFEQEGVTPEGKVVGHFKATGLVPKCLKRLKAYGVMISPDIFKQSR
jgi:pilus assembly protein CpaF